MLAIEKVIKENQEEFMDMVIKFVKEKTSVKQKKSPKTICHFYALGKTYDSNIFARNYEDFLVDTSKILGYDGFKEVLKGFVRKGENEFPVSHKGKTSMVKLNNGGVVSCYSGTPKKLKHIRGLCDIMGITLTMK
jgi:cyclophilin family peptidyl-prolyl cis-trans isomerase